MRKIIHQKRLELYLEVFEQVELLLKDWKKIFDKEYFEKIASYKSRIKLLASEKTTEEYKKYYEALRTSVNAYKKFKDDNDPQNNYVYQQDEDGEWVQVYSPTVEDYEEYANKIECYEKEQKKFLAAGKSIGLGSVTALSNWLSPIIGMTPAILVPAIILILHTTSKMGVKAYCSTKHFVTE